MKVKGLAIQVEDDFDKALSKFHFICNKDGILAELSKREYFEKPSVKRRMKFLKAVKRQKEMTRWEQLEEERAYVKPVKLTPKRERKPQPQKAVSPVFSFDVNVNPTRNELGAAVKALFNMIKTA